MKTFRKIKSDEVKVGMCFSAPVFFDDGKNMFLAEGKTIKPYHIEVLKRWVIPFVLTYGSLTTQKSSPVNAVTDDSDIEELEEIDELEPVETPVVNQHRA